MGATLNTPPATYNLDGDSIEANFTTDRITPGRSSIELAFSGSPVADETIEISWPGTIVTLTAKASPDNSGNQIPLQGGLTLAAYADEIKERLEQNEILAGKFIFSRGSSGTENVTLNAPLYEEINFAVTNGLTNVAETVTNYAGLQDDNLKVLVKLYKTQNSIDTFLATLHTSYDLTQLPPVAGIDFSQLLNLSPHLPPQNTILADPYSYGVATDAFCSFYFRYADKYGSPAVAEALVKSGTYHCLHGATSKDATTTFFPLLGEIKAHNYSILGTALMPKVISTEQPDYFYYFPRGIKSNQRIHAIITWSNGDITHEYIATGVTLLGNTLYYFPCGYEQLGLHTLVNGDAFIVAYRFAVGAYDIDNNDDTFLPQVEVYYQVDCFCHPWNIYLLMDNGLGGCETIRLKGRRTEGFEADKERIEFEDGRLEDVNARGQSMIEASTGWYPVAYTKHLRQMLLGKLWLIDLENERFLPVVADINNMTDYEDDVEEGFAAFNVTIKRAAIESAFNSF